MGPQLKTSFRLNQGILLRTFRESDADELFRTVENNRVHLKGFMHWMTPDYSQTSALEFITNSIGAAQRGEGLSLGIFRDQIFIGSIGFVSFEWTARKTEIGYWIAKEEEGRGTVSAACRLLIEYAFGDLGLNRVEIRCSTENTRSAAVAEGLGFKREGVLRQAELRDGRLHDFIIYGLLAAEWRTREI